MMDITKTGIPGFDKLLGGGFPRNKSILLSGVPGTGKTIFALQYIYNGAVKFKEKGLYLTFEENVENLRFQAKAFGWDLEELEKKGMIRILDIAAPTITESTCEVILRIIQEQGYSRFVVDSLSTLAINMPTTFASATALTDISIKRFMYLRLNKLKQIQTTALLISPTTGDQLSGDGVSEFICDGIVHIKYDASGGKFSRYMTIRKMRGVKHDEGTHPLEIGESGIVVHDPE